MDSQKQSLKFAKPMKTFKIEVHCYLWIDESWLVEMGEGDDPVFSFKPEFPGPYPGLSAIEAMSPEDHERYLASPVQLDPWLMREKFFRIDDPTDALEFFKEYGIWQFCGLNGDQSSESTPQELGNQKRNPSPIRFSELIYQRNFFEEALNTKPSEWQRRAFITTGNLDKDAALIWETMYLHGGPDISVVNLHDTTFPGPFTGTISCHDIRHALRATIFLDWMEGREWTRCKACRRVFKRTSKHPQFYCCSACASRARQATFRKNRANHRRGRR
jgi:hypothetical protein